MRPLRILTWHVHGSYLHNLVQEGRHEYFLPVKPGFPPGYGGRRGNFTWPDNVHDVPAEQVRDLQVDCVLYQSRANYLADRYEVLSEAQRRLPAVYLEHDPPREHPTDAKHPADDPNTLLVHVTHFNRLMWDSGCTPTVVVEHGVAVPDGLRYMGDLARGLTVVNEMARRGRRLGVDIFERVRQDVALDLAGMGSDALGGFGDIPHDQLLRWEVRYRLFFNPIRYTSLGLAVCEAMMLGLPIVGLATTEMAVTVENGRSGYVDTDVRRLVDRMRDLLADPAEARRLGEGARAYARERFNIDRFLHDWDEVYAAAVGRRAFTGAAVSGLGQRVPSGDRYD